MAKWKHRHIIETARTFLIDAKFPAQFWVDAAYDACIAINRLLTHVLDGFSPIEKLFHKTLDYSFLKLFGCACFPNLTHDSKHKLEPRSKQCIIGVMIRPLIVFM